MSKKQFLLLLLAFLLITLFALLPALFPAAETTAGSAAETVAESPAETAAPAESADDSSAVMELLALNVGKADCLLLRCGDTAYLIDTGRGKTFSLVEETLLSEGVTHLDGVILTHTDNDHIGGLKKLLKSDIEVDNIYASAFYATEEKGDRHPVEKIAFKMDRDVTFLQGGDALPFPGGTLSVLGPLSENTEKDDSNSIVLLAEGAGVRFLLAGDMEFPEEEELLSAGVIPNADLLKVANHGDSDATSDAFLAAVRPSVAVISTSTAEKASTPSGRVLRALRAWNVDVYETQDADSLLRFTARDGKITVIVE